MCGLPPPIKSLRTPLPSPTATSPQYGQIDIDSELVLKQDLMEGTKDTVTQLANGTCACQSLRVPVLLLLSMHFCSCVGGLAWVRFACCP